MFIDTLAFQQATLLIAAVIVAYVGVLALWAMRKNDAAGLAETLRSGAVPVGSIGAVATLLGLYGEFAWPLPGSYNILFTDVYLLFGATLVILAVAMATGSKLQFAGLFGLVSGGVTVAYGWAGYNTPTATGVGLTKDPLETLLLYGAFGLTAVLSFPVTVMVDHYRAHPESSLYTVSLTASVPRPSLSGASRAVQPVVPGTGTGPAEPAAPRIAFRLPLSFRVTMLAFLTMAALAALAALLYLNTTLPAHLAAAP